MADDRCADDPPLRDGGRDEPGLQQGHERRRHQHRHHHHRHHHDHHDHHGSHEQQQQQQQQQQPLQPLPMADVHSSQSQLSVSQQHSRASVASLSAPANGFVLSSVTAQPTSRVGLVISNCDPQQCQEQLLDSGVVAIPYSSMRNVELRWVDQPRHVLLVKKSADHEASEALRTAVACLRKLRFVAVAEDEVCAEAPELALLQFSRVGQGAVDLVVTFGGDGTVLYANSLFSESVPPVLAVRCGSLGFLTNIDQHMLERKLRDFHDGESTNITMRMRLVAKVRRADGTVDGEPLHVLNEVVIDRGPSPYLTSIDCYCNGHFFTNVQADGVIISSTTGSTGYSLSAGGSMVHADVRAILLTPICPHTLSFRPLVLPDSVELRFQMPETARAGAMVSFDGRSRRALERGESVEIAMSQWPLVCVTHSEHPQAEWLEQLSSRLNWNQRARQKPLDDSAAAPAASSAPASGRAAQQPPRRPH